MEHFDKPSHHKDRTGMHRRILYGLTLIVTCSLWCSCGKKADPGLPVSHIPDAPRSFQAVARAEGILLVWRAPDHNMDDSPLLDLAGFVIQRAEMPLDKACRTCPHEFRELFDYPYAGQRGVPPDRRLFTYQDTALTFKRLYIYTVQCYNERDHRGKPAKLEVAWDVPPASPSDLRAEQKNRLVRLTWSTAAALSDGSPCTDLVGYTLYRTMTRGSYEKPLVQEPITETVFEDVPETMNVTYYYTVRAVRRVEQTFIESLPSQEIEVAYLDLQPPGTPEGLTVIPTSEGILLKWIPKLEKDLAGINVYRSTTREGGFVKLNDQPIAENSWIDRTAKPGNRYFYAITAVDRSPQANESSMSEPAEVVYRIK